MVSFSSFDRPLTQETPTPCKPPDTLYEFWSNLPPACSSVMTISAAERFGSCLSSIFRPVGTPRPLSVIEIELSEWMVTWISVQWPASDSSMELSSTSNTRWCRPVPSEVSPMYMPGRLRTASRPSRIWMEDAPYSSVLAGTGTGCSSGMADMDCFLKYRLLGATDTTPPGLVDRAACELQ